MNQEYFDQTARPETPGVAATKTMIDQTVTNAVLYSALVGAWDKFIAKESFSGAFTGAIKSKLLWGLSAGLGALSAIFAYGDAKRVEKNYDRLLDDNIAMRQQLNQTGQILLYVANQVKHGHMPNGQLALDESTAPPTHVARLEAEKATQALADTAPTAGTQIG